MQQNAMFGGQAAYAQQLSYPMQAAMSPGMPPPPPPPPPMPPAHPGMGAMYTHGGGIYGEQFAMSAARMGHGFAGGMNTAAGIGMGLGAMAVPGMAGMALGAGAMIPAYLGAKAIDAYGGNFAQGMQNQAQLNSTLRQNFRFFGGQGHMGRGFNQNQMGQIGQTIQNELNDNVFTSAGELNQLVSQGAQSGMFTGVRDVQDFSQKFRKMIDTLKTVQQELGGSLSEALDFVNQSKQAGIFQQVDQTNFATQMQGAEAASGLSRSQLMGLSTQGAQIARSVGGYGRQGAYGALRAASTLGGAVQSGVINEELLSEATGGRTGNEAVQSMVGQMMQRSARFSRRGMGRFSLYAMSNADGTGLDQGMMDRFLAGDISTSSVSRSAHSNVARMGRARAINQEGTLRGAMMEQGGLAGQIGMMRLMVGDRVMDQSDDLASLVLQRRFRMNRPQAQMMMSLMRNQGTIAEQEAYDRQGAGRQAALQTDIRENRSMDSFMRHLSHGVQDRTGMLKAQELGRRVMSRVSSLVERATNDMLGIAENSLTQRDNHSLNRLAMGRGSAEDLEQLGLTGGNRGAAGLGVGGGGASLFQGGMFERRTRGQILQARGITGVASYGSQRVSQEVDAMTRARQGDLVRGSDRKSFLDLSEDADNTIRQITRAQMLSGGGGDFYARMGVGNGGPTANAIDAFMQQNGLRLNDTSFGQGAMMNRGGGILNRQNLLDDFARMSSAGTLEGVREQWGRFGRGGELLMQGASIGEIGQEIGSNVLANMSTTREIAAGRLARGGSMARRLRQGGAQTSRGLFGTGDLSDNDRMLRALTTSSESMEALLGNEDTAGALDAITGAETMDIARNQLNLFRRRVEGNDFGDDDMRSAGRSLVAQLEGAMEGGDIQDFRSRGVVTTLRAGTQMSEDAIRQRNERLSQISGNYSILAGNLENAGLGEGSALRRLATSISRGFGGAIGSNTLDESILDQQNELRNMVVGMDTDSDEYRQVAAKMGRNDEGRAFMASVANSRRLQRDMSGEGRRGRRGGAESVFGALTGTTLSSMELNYTDRRGRRREVDPRRRANYLRRVFAHGSTEQQRDAREQLHAQLRQLQVGAGEATEMVSTVANAYSDGRISSEEAQNIEQMTSGNTALQTAQREAVMNRQHQQNPLDTTRNDLLERIVRAVEKNTDEDKSVPEGEAG